MKYLIQITFFNKKRIRKELYFTKELDGLDDEDKKRQYIEDLTASLDLYDINVCNISLDECLSKALTNLTEFDVLPKTKFNKLIRDFKKYGYEVV